MTEKKKKADIWMAFYVADYLSATTHLSTERHGAYMLLIFAAWKRGGSLPKDDSQLAEITKLGMAKWRASKAVLLEFFDDVDGCYIHRRVAKEHVKAMGNSGKKSENGKKGAEKRWQTDSKTMANAMANGLQNDGEVLANESQSAWQTDTPSPSPSPIPIFNTVNSKNNGGGINAHEAKAVDNSRPPEQPPPIPENFKEALELRPDLNGAMVYANFVGYFDEGKRTLSRWQKWVQNEDAPSAKTNAKTITVPGPPGRDPELQRMDAEAHLRKPIPPEIRSKFKEMLAEKGIRTRPSQPA